MSMKDEAAAFVASSASRIAQTAGKTISDAVDKAKADVVAEYEAKIAILQKDAEDAKAIYTATIADLEAKLAAAAKPAL